MSYTAIGKNVYYDVLDDVVNKYNNTKHSTIKMKPIDVRHNNKKRVYIDEHNEKRSRFKVGDRVRISKFKNIFAKGYIPNWSKEIFIVDKINDTVPYTYNLKDLNDEEIIGSFYNQELHKKLNYKMSAYYPPYRSSSNNIKVELDLANYATKHDLKNITNVDVSSFASKTNLAALKTKVHKIDTDKLKIVPDDLAKLFNVVKNEVVKKTAYNTLKNKVDVTDTSKLVLMTKFTTDTNSLDDKIDKFEKKIPDISGLASKTELTAVENKIPDISGLVTASALTAVENKIPDITSLITKRDFDTKFKSVSDRVTNNKSRDILLDNELKKLKTRVDSSEKIKLNDVQKEISFNRGFFYYLQQSYLVY